MPNASWRARNGCAARDGGHRCVYCGAKRSLTIDHVIPRSDGGPNILANKVIACRNCNGDKASQPLFLTNMTIRFGVYASENATESLYLVSIAINNHFNPKSDTNKEIL